MKIIVLATGPPPATANEPGVMVVGVGMKKLARKSLGSTASKWPWWTVEPSVSKWQAASFSCIRAMPVTPKMTPGGKLFVLTLVHKFMWDSGGAVPIP